MDITNTQTALIALVDSLHLEINRGNCALLFLLELLAAINTVNHEVLIKYLQDLVGIHGTALNWFCFFLSSRFQRLVVNACSSSRWDLSCRGGVPQGYIISSLLLNVYIRLLGEIMWRFGTQMTPNSTSPSPLTLAYSLSSFLVAGCSWGLDEGELIEDESRQDRGDGSGQTT